jgi:7-cyano-7-deazaguanine synthase in queuosine biosynthesis
MKKAVVLLSGGVDSTVTLAVAKSRGFDICAVSFDYGQRHRHIILHSDLGVIGGSALTTDLKVPKGREELVEEIPVTYVPARNTILQKIFSSVSMPLITAVIRTAGPSLSVPLKQWQTLLQRHLLRAGPPLRYIRR